MKRNQKFAKESYSTMTEMVMPNDTNTLNNLMGGKLMHHMDIVAAISAQRHSNSAVVTASVDNVSFGRSIALGNVVTLHAKVTRAFTTSMEIKIDVYAENIPANTKHKTNEAFFTFVAVNLEGRPVKIPELIPETPDEEKLFESALRRRQFRLLSAGKIKPEEATELKSLFDL